MKQMVLLEWERGREGTGCSGRSMKEEGYSRQGKYSNATRDKDTLLQDKPNTVQCDSLTATHLFLFSSPLSSIAYFLLNVLTIMG